MADLRERLRRVADGLVVVTADNPGPMTLRGTCSYVVGAGPVAIIDPGPRDPAHLDALLEVVDGRAVAHLLLTHAHGDHSGLAADASQRFGVPVSASPLALQRLGLEGTGRALPDGERLAAGSVTLSALHAPGHSADHVCYLAEPGRDLFAGDLVLGEGSSAILHPDGSVTACFASLARLLALRPGRLLPGHGPPVADGASRLAEYRRHRRERERQIEAALDAGAADVPSIREVVYGPLPPGLVAAADATVAAHLAALSSERRDVPAFDRYGAREEDVAADLR